MSRELIGSNGNIVGSERYFERLNREHFIGNLMRNPNGTEYYDCLRGTASQIRDTVQEIYEDLFAAVICFKYLLPVAEFHRVCDALNYEINVLCGKTKQFQKNKILSCMGFPDNWLDIKTVGSAELHESTDK